jgi:hypothetical protein
MQLKGYLQPISKAVNEAQADAAGLADVMAIFLRLWEIFASFSDSDMRRAAQNALEVRIQVSSFRVTALSAYSYVCSAVGVYTGCILRNVMG